MTVLTKSANFVCGAFCKILSQKVLVEKNKIRVGNMQKAFQTLEPNETEICYRKRCLTENFANDINLFI